MSRITLAPNASGSGTLTVAAPNTNTDRTLTLPDVTTTLVGTDATQTLTNKSIAASQLTGALPALDGSALTGVNSMTLLGTLTTTSGTTQTLSSLVLTNYKQLFISVRGVSFTALVTLLLDSKVIGAALTTATEFFEGFVIVDLASGVMDATLTNKQTGGSASQVTGYAYSSTITTASTSISFTGGTFDAGSIRIYGVK